MVIAFKVVSLIIYTLSQKSLLIVFSQSSYKYYRFHFYAINRLLLDSFQ